MKTIKTIILGVLMSSLLAGNIFAAKVQPNDNDGINGWVWVSDNNCIQFKMHENTSRSALERSLNLGLVTQWADVEGIKERETYMGTWSQDEFGTWSFRFDDFTIPVSLTRIDGVLYSFNGFGQLKEDVLYWDAGESGRSPRDNTYGRRTGSDGVVTDNSPEFLAYLETQYLPECFTAE